MMSFRFIPLSLFITAAAWFAAGCGSDGKPEIQKVEPATVSAAGGHVVVIDGKNFDADAQVLLGVWPAEVRSATDGRLEIVTPTGVAGTYDVTVRTTKGADIRKNALSMTPVALRYDPAPGAIPASPSGPLMALAGLDANLDGAPDVAALTTDGAFRLALNQGQGRFTWTETLDASAVLDGRFSALVSGDFDADGAAEILLCGKPGTADSRLDFASDGSFVTTALDLRSSFSTCHDLIPLPPDADGKTSLLTWRSRPDVPSLRQLMVLRNTGSAFQLDEAVGEAADVTRPVTADVEGAIGSFSSSTEQSAGGKASGRLEYDFTVVRTTLRVSFPLPELTWIPQSVRFEFYGDASGHTLSLALVDASGERFSHSGAALTTASWGTLEATQVSGWLPSGGDGNGVFDLPATALELTLTPIESGPATGALFVDNLIVTGPVAGRYGVTDFERPITPIWASDEVTSTVWTLIDGLEPADAAFTTAKTGENALLHLVLGAGETGDWSEAGQIPLPVGRIRRLVPLDVDFDGDLDLVAVGSGQDQCLIHDGRGSFFNDTIACLPISRGDGRDAVTADANLDGLADLFVTAADGLCRLFEADGAGGFIDVTPVFGLDCENMTALVLLDADGNGLVDALFLDGSGLPVLFMGSEE
ncbi:VCBS repeat-containing protein [Myxococcota bacterium]|nr:VCBS repeat-containing protein [Myxococcota bacterium]